MKKAKYNVDIVKLIRNNSIVVGEEKRGRYNTYFMLDYFDVLYHRTLEGKDKNYSEFWNMLSHAGEQNIKYKVACKILSLYAEYKTEENIFNFPEDALSQSPFLGIIQINIAHQKYQNILVEDILMECEKIITECLTKNLGHGTNTKYKMYRSSTSGDFCLVMKCAAVREIYSASILINNLIINLNHNRIKFNTYTNIGIECVNVENHYLTLNENIINENADCNIALRFTANNDYARRLFEKIKAIDETSCIIKSMDGLFGRYDFLIHMSIQGFSKIYPALCAVKLGKVDLSENVKEDIKFSEETLWYDLLKKGILERKIKIINERVLVSLHKKSFDLKGVANVEFEDSNLDKDVIYKEVKEENDKFKIELEKFRQLGKYFVEKRRNFADINRAIKELIETYIPQGMESDSYVNWKILVNDLWVIFKYKEQWEEKYINQKSNDERQEMREFFLENMRLLIDAINQFYKFLQNVNAQTWQSPLYEIQTQLDAEKMMIAYREFLFDYFWTYKQKYENNEDERPMIYPIIYPDLTESIVSVKVPFTSLKDVDERILICKVPSFEYYGRMFNMIPWILHEASHYIRTKERQDRNEYLVDVILRKVFEEALYKLLNKYSNDLGCCRLGRLENKIVKVIAENARKAFCENLSENNMNLIKIENIQWEVYIFLRDLFEKSIDGFTEKYNRRNIVQIKKILLHHLSKLKLLSGRYEIEIKEILTKVDNCAYTWDEFCYLLKIIYEEYYQQIFSQLPEKDDWKLLELDSCDFENVLTERIERYPQNRVYIHQIREFCFTMRELNRLYGAWTRQVDNNYDEKRRELWKKCIPEIRNVINSGFEQNAGFPELYRILNMIFGSGTQLENDDIKRIGREFNVLVKEEVQDLVEREITLYRETCADTYMVAYMGLSAFGYCRQMFQTVSDTNYGDSIKWDNSINVHRFRVVMAVLLGKEGEKILDLGNDNIAFSMENLLVQCEKYCMSCVQCVKETIQSDLQNKINATKENENSQWVKVNYDEKFELLKKFCEGMNATLKDIFKYYDGEVSVLDAVNTSMLEMYAHCANEEMEFAYHEELDAYISEIKGQYENIQKELEVYAHVFYRIKCFILLLDLVGNKKRVIVGKKEYEHMVELYKSQFDTFNKIGELPKVVKVVSEFYNNPDSIEETSYAEMLEDTIEFIEKYYYDNRFKIMSWEDGGNE